MLHKKRPDEDGWYWILTDGSWVMGHLDMADEPPRFYVVGTERGAFMMVILRAPESGNDWKPHGSDDRWTIDAWIGPLGCPGGDFASDIMEFTYERHQEAEERNKALVMTVVDTTPCEESFGLCIQTGMFDKEKAIKAVATVWPHSG